MTTLPEHILTGADHEWEQTPEGYWQNRYCPRVFRDEDGHAYDIEGRIFRSPEGLFVSGESVVPVTFPCLPRREIVEVA